MSAAGLASRWRAAASSVFALSTEPRAVADPPGKSVPRGRPPTARLGRDWFTAIRLRHRPGTPQTAWRSVLRAIGTTVLGLSLWAVAYALVISSVQEARSQHELYATFRAQAAQALAPVATPIPVGAPVAVLNIPAVGLRDAVVVEGTTADLLRAGPGHQRNTALPGQPGVCVLLGRSLTFGAPFAHLSGLRAGDTIHVVTGQGSFHFRVLDVRHKGDLLPAPPAEGAGRLVLETAEHGDWSSGWSARGVVYVDAAQQGSSQPDPGGRPAISAAERPMAAGSGPLLSMELVLLLLLLLGCTTVAAWAQVRWGRAQVWLAATPVLIAVLWGLSTTAVQLLPNLL